jgi:hypothetical protein
MKYQYGFHFIGLANGSKVLAMDLPKEIELVAAFLSEIGRNEKWYIEGMNAVLSDQEAYQERSGEFYGLEIRKDFTRVHDVFGEGEECKIETSELKEIIEIWAERNKKYLAE